MRATRVVGPALLVLTAICCASGVACHHYYGGTPSECELAALKVDAIPVIKQLDAAFESTGRYPSDLAEAGIELPRARYGGWRYWVERDGSAYGLSVGDYLYNGVVLIWVPSRRDWYLDT